MGCPRLRDVDVKHPGLRWTSLAIYLGFIFALVALFTGSWSSGSAGFRAGLLYSAAPAVNLSSVVYFRDCIGTHPVLSLRLANAHLEVLCGTAVAAAIALCAVAVLAALAAVLLASRLSRGRHNVSGRPAYLRFAGIGSCAAGVCMLFAMLLWLYVHGRINDAPAANGFDSLYDASLGTSFATCVLGWLLGLTAAALFFTVPPLRVQGQNMYAALARSALESDDEDEMLQQPQQPAGVDTDFDSRIRAEYHTEL